MNEALQGFAAHRLGAVERDSPAGEIEAATLRALEQALATGEIEPVPEPHPRPALRLVEGTARQRTAPRGHLRLLDRPAPPDELPPASA